MSTPSSAMSSWAQPEPVRRLHHGRAAAFPQCNLSLAAAVTTFGVGGAVVSHGQLYVQSGFTSSWGIPGHVLLCFGL
jgi:hypothetical protein